MDDKRKTINEKARKTRKILCLPKKIALQI